VRYGGEQFHIRSGPYSAVVTEVGATLRSLRHGDRDLVVGFQAGELRPVYRGAVLAPWPNRIVDGRYEFAGAVHQLPLTEPGRGHALHGLVSWVPWQTVEHTADRVVLGYRIHPCDGYPFRIDLRADYVLHPDGLTWRVSARNTGDAAAPYGCAPHPYLKAGDGTLDDWLLELPADRYQRVTPDRLLPRDIVGVAGTEFDFRTARQIGDTRIDHAFTGIRHDRDGLATVRLVGPSGEGVRIRWDASCPWVQVHTADRAEPEASRSGLAVEPMTCPPDAFNSGVDLVVLPPGAHHAVSWLLSAT
jgi:aldose 1-epimerase